MALKWVILDAMGVLFEDPDDVEALLIPFVRQRTSDVSPARIRAVYRRASLGEIPSATLWQELGLGPAYPAIEREYLDTCPRLDPACREVMRALQPEYHLAILSNDVAEWAAYLRARFGLDELSETAVISGEVGVRKPAARIYEILLERIDAAPAACVFVDDDERRLHAAAALGIRGIHFVRGDAAEASTHFPTVTAFTELPAAVSRVFA